MKKLTSRRRINGYACLIGSGGERGLNQHLTKALETMKHRAWTGYHRTVNDTSSRSKVVVGYCLDGEDAGETAAPIHGNIYYSKNPNTPNEIERLAENPSDLVAALRDVDGDYTLLFPSEEKVVFARSPLGVKPLFIGRSEGLVGIASEAKALRAVGLKAESVHPGFVYQASLKGIDRFSIRSVDESGQRLDVGLEEASETILRLLRKSVEMRMKGRERRRIAIGFSGGVDSSLLTLLASQIGDVKLVSVYTSGSSDEAGVKAAARLLGLELIEVTLTPKEVAEKMRGIAELTEKQSAMDVAIAMAINTSASTARDEGCDCLLLGQLADELFGGYRRYLRIYSEEGAEATHKAMMKDTVGAYSANFERDEAAASPYTDLRLPYASLELAEYALSLNPQLKINPENDERKIVLREAALQAGVPKELALKPKKALQFSSNLQKIISNILPAR
ncbi:MAG: asparagine synthase-related protein [Thaumarchaeota archaeon]|nr:asparagine synthase-related protein [Nitrososphaerota archaeon]MCL5317990.1 asparagine synthase-related protein [Nitrososphaerota archaeon]